MRSEGNLLETEVMVDKKSKKSCSQNKKLYSEIFLLTFVQSSLLFVPECVHIWWDCPCVFDKDQVDVGRGGDDEEDLDRGVVHRDEVGEHVHVPREEDKEEENLWPEEKVCLQIFVTFFLCKHS